MAISINKSKIQKYLYIFFGLLTVIWLVYLVIQFWNSQYQQVASSNSGLIVSANNSMQNLPTPGDIKPGQTSGLLSPTISSYLSAQQGLKDISNKLDDSTPFHTGFKYLMLLNTNNDANKELKNSIASLDNTYNALVINQKFIEYNPGIDLQPIISGDEEGDSERLTRTKAGLSQTIEELEASNITYKSEIVAIIKPLESKVLDINPNNAKTWQTEVLEAQKSIINIIDSDFDSYTETSSVKLLELSRSY